MGLKWLPNAVTILRCVLAVWVGWLIVDFSDGLSEQRAHGIWLAFPFLAFVFVAATDWIDGALARALDAQSAFGARLDPIADKLLVGISLLALCYIDAWMLLLLIPTVAIVGRDVLLTAMREALGNPTGMKVSRMAKWKTAIAMISVGLILLGMPVSELAHYADRFSPGWLASRGVLLAGIAGIWASAFMSVVTAIDYVSAAARPGN